MESSLPWRQQTLPWPPTKAVELASAVDTVVFFVGSDLASACARAKQEVAYRFRLHNEQAGYVRGGVVLLVDGQCVAHVLHRETASAFQAKQLIGRLHATAFSCSMPWVANSVFEALQLIAEEDLRTGFYPNLCPSSAVACAHSAALAEATLLRRRLVRARHEDEEHVPDELASLFLEPPRGSQRPEKFKTTK